MKIEEKLDQFISEAKKRSIKNFIDKIEFVRFSESEFSVRFLTRYNEEVADKIIKLLDKAGGSWQKVETVKNGVELDIDSKNELQTIKDISGKLGIPSKKLETAFFELKSGDKKEIEVKAPKQKK